MSTGTKFLVVSVCWTVFCFVFGFLLFPRIVDFCVRDQTALRKRNELRDIYLKLPFPMTFSVYFFNISNPNEVQNGAKPILKEIGPYAYDAWKSKIDVVENDLEDSLTYSPLDVYYFNSNKSGFNLDHNDYVTILNPLVVGIVNQVTRDSPALLPIVSKAITAVFNPETIYLTARVRDILFDGMTINCSVKEFSAKAMCTQLKTQLPDLKEVEKNIFMFGFLSSRNDTIGKRMKVKRGIKNSKELGKVLEYNNQKEMNLYDGKLCNRYVGTDGWVFPPFLTEEEGIKTYSPDLCRNIKAEYVEDTKYRGVPVRKYYADLGDQQGNPADKCYCPTPTTCLQKGVLDLSKCMGVPIYATLPHFERTDPMLLEQVEGLHPEGEKHLVTILFESMVGAPLEAYKRMQFNLPIAPNPKVPIMKSIPVALHPIIWVEEGIAVEGPLLTKIKTVFILLKMQKYGLWVCIAVGFGGIAFSIYLYYKNRHKAKITPIHMLHQMFNPNKEEKVEYIRKPTPFLENPEQEDGFSENNSNEDDKEKSGKEKKGIYNAALQSDKADKF